MYIAPTTQIAPTVSDLGTPAVRRQAGDFAQVLKDLLIGENFAEPTPDVEQMAQAEKDSEEGISDENEMLPDPSSPEVLQFEDQMEADLLSVNLQSERPNAEMRKRGSNPDLTMLPNDFDVELHSKSAGLPFMDGVSTRHAFRENPIFPTEKVLAEPIWAAARQITPPPSSSSKSAPAILVEDGLIAPDASKPIQVLPAVAMRGSGIVLDPPKRNDPLPTPAQISLPEVDRVVPSVPMRHDQNPHPSMSAVIFSSLPADSSVPIGTVKSIAVDGGAVENALSFSALDVQKVGPLNTAHPADARNTTQTYTPATAQQLAVAVHKTQDGVTSLILNPEELGRVKLAITTQDGIMAVAITTERAETQDLMRRHIDMLAQEMRELGYENVGFSFEGRGDGDHEGQTNPEQITEQENLHLDAPSPSSTNANQSGLDLRL